MVTYSYWELYVSDVKGKMERGELIPDPEWQRGYIWNQKDEQLLIDSILKGLPIPKFYLTEEYDAKKGVSIHYAVDGQQRLKAINRFLTNKFLIEINSEKYLFKDLDSETQKKITTYKLNGHYMTDYKQADINFLFQRLNSTGVKLTNMERWNNEYFEANILKMVKEIYEKICDFPYKRDYRDYDDKDYEKLKSSYMATIYTEENIKRMLPLDDIIDLCNCLKKNSIEGGGKKELESFLKLHINISHNESSIIKSKFGKALNNIKEIFSKQELEASAYSKRTHFISLFLAVGSVIPKYYILNETEKLKTDLLNFIENQPEEYKESVLGAIRQKVARETRVSFFNEIILKYAKELDKNRLFDESLRQKLWREYDHKCQICKKEIKNYKDATLDHKEPWAKGGRTEESNAQLAHKKCNQEKRDKFEEFVIV
jgi:5-methylcytosine-specific restriction endonuclease McrA